MLLISSRLLACSTRCCAPARPGPRVDGPPGPRSQARPLMNRTPALPRLVVDVMTPEVYTVDEDTDLGIVAQRMLEANVKRFPVLRGDRVVGIVSRHDLVKVIASPDPEVEA